MPGLKSLLTFAPVLLLVNSSPLYHVVEEGNMTSVTTALNITKLEWTKCKYDGEGVDCANMTVPLDWDNPQPDKTTIVAVSRLRCTDPSSRKGSIFLNYGGPAPMLGRLGELSDELQSHYDVVTMDPRGMGRSSPLNCTEYFSPCSSDWPTTQEQYETNNQCTKSAFEQCAGEYPLVKYMDSISMAHDIEALRFALFDEEKLAFIGMSWGTQLATTYLEQFPDKTDAIYLDSVLDYTMSPFDYLLASRKATQTAFDHFADWCKANEACPLRNNNIRDVATRAFDQAGTDATCLSKSIWHKLDALKYSDLASDLHLAQTGNLPIPDCVRAPFSTTAHLIMACHNSPTSNLTFADLEQQTLNMESQTPTFAGPDFWSRIHTACIGFPFARNPMHVLDVAEGSALPRAMVMNSKFDLSTPIAGARHLAAQIPGSVFVESRKAPYGHITYDPGSEGSLATGIVDAFFINGTMPEHGTVIDY